MSDPKTYTAADIQVALKERLKKFENQLKELHGRELRKDEHMEPGVHEAAAVGEGQHVEPGGHENAVMPMPQSPAEQPVGSSHGIPQGQLQDLCPMCGQPDMPGQCTCLNGGGNEGLDPGIIDPAAAGVPSTPLALNEEQGYGPGAGPLAMSECEHGATCKSCGPMKKGYDFVDVKGKLGSKGNHPDSVLPDDKKPKKVKSQDDNKVKENFRGLSKDSELDKAYISPTSTHGLSHIQGPVKPPKPVSDADHEADKKAAGLTKYNSPSALHGVSKPAGSVPPPKPVSDADHAADKKAAGLGKAGPPMAKPPSGGPAGAVAPPPAAKAVAPKVGGPAGGPKVMGKGEETPKKPKKPVVMQAQPDAERKSEEPMDKAALGMDASKMAGVHAAVDSFKAKGATPGAAPAKPMPSPAAHAGRAASFGSAMAGDFQPKGPVHSGLELAPKKMAAPGRLAMKKELSKSMGVCLFCGNGEHGGMCGLAKNIQTSLAKVASPLFQPVPKLKPAGVGHPGHISQAAQEKTTVNGPAGDATKATPIRAQAAASAPTQMAAPNRLIAKGEEKAKPTHVCAAPLCTKGISGSSEFCSKHKPKGNK